MAVDVRNVLFFWGGGRVLLWENPCEVRCSLNFVTVWLFVLVLSLKIG